METPQFNRHKHMDFETLKRIQTLITDLSIIERCDAYNVINMLYGAFDGYDYSDQILKDNLLVQLTNGGNTPLVKEIKEIAKIVKSYPKHS